MIYHVSIFIKLLLLSLQSTVFQFLRYIMMLYCMDADHTNIPSTLGSTLITGESLNGYLLSQRLS